MSDRVNNPINLIDVGVRGLLGEEYRWQRREDVKQLWEARDHSKEMQQVPCRLTQTIWTAFKAAKPVRRPRVGVQQWRPTHVHRLSPRMPRIVIQTRYYSDDKSELDKKVDDAKSRIEKAFDARIEVASEPDTRLKHLQHESIVHTVPEASSIVHSTTKDSKPPESLIQHSATNAKPSPPLPSQTLSSTSTLRLRFASLMDNYQSYLFTASQRLNDLTGYSAIQTLKDSITTQEELVASNRHRVKSTRSAYAEAIKLRSETQREVNDLLHRKHAWSPDDLEKFTRLYRSDHTNEQNETAAQRAVGEAEQEYEEASTKLARTILARYHEEQIWSDKIRQMSTWGTWGLMGLNVLLFVVFQILIEPWRRKRLVKGFEEKVEVALRGRDEQLARGAAVLPNSIGAVADAPEKPAGVSSIADHIAEQIVDAVTGATAPPPTSPQTAAAAATRQKQDIEAAAEAITDQELCNENAAAGIMTDAGEYKGMFATSTSKGFAYYEDAFRELWSERQMVVTQKDLTTVALEGAAGGAALMGLVVLLLRPK